MRVGYNCEIRQQLRFLRGCPTYDFQNFPCLLPCLIVHFFGVPISTDYAFASWLIVAVCLRAHRH